MTRAADDFEEIRKHQVLISRKVCGKTAGIKLEECWCYKAGENGSHLPCPKPESVAALQEVSCGYAWPETVRCGLWTPQEVRFLLKYGVIDGEMVLPSDISQGLQGLLREE